MRFGRFVETWTGLACGLALALSQASARADEPAAGMAGWVTADAAAFFELARPAELLDRLTDPELAEFYATVPGLNERLKAPEILQARAFAGLLAGSLGTTPEKALRRLVAGGFVLALEPGCESEPVRFFAILTPGDPDFLAQAHARLLTLAGAQKKDSKLKRGEHRGIDTYPLSDAEAHAIVEGRLVVANGLPALQAVIDRALGECDSARLADDATWKAAREAIGPDRLAFAFARLETLRKLDPKHYGGEEPDPGPKFLFGPWIEAVGRSDWAAAGIDWRDGLASAALVVPEPPDGFSPAMARFRPAEGQGAVPPLEPPGTILSASLWRDLESIWEVRQEIFPPEQLVNLAQLDSTAGTFFGGRDFGTGVLGSIGREWRLVIAHQEYEAMDPSPDQKLPGFALVVGLKPDDEEFAVRLRAAFQSFVGLANLGSAQQQAPPLMLGSEEYRGVTLATSRYLAPKGVEPTDAPVDPRFNFSPTAALVGDTFVLSSSSHLARSLVACLLDGEGEGNASEPGPTLLIRADGAELARLVDLNRDQLATRNMLQKGNTRANARGEVELLARLLRYLGRGRLSVEDREASVLLNVEFQLSN